MTSGVEPPSAFSRRSLTAFFQTRIGKADERELAALGVSSFVVLLLLEAIGGAGADLLFNTWTSRVIATTVLVVFWLGVIAVPVSVIRGTGFLPQSLRRFAPLLLPAALIVPVLLLGAVGVDVNNADGPVLVSAVDHVWGIGGPQWLLESQDAPVPHLLYGIPLSLGASADRLVLVPVLVTAALGLWVARQVHLRTGSIEVAALCGMVTVSLPPVFGQASRLPLYPLFTLAGLVGLAGLVQWIKNEAGLRSLLLGALGIAVAVATHGAGLYFAPMAFMTAVFITDRHRLKRWLGAMVAVGVANLPWFVSHLWISGLTRVSTPRDSWFLTNGHLLKVNEEFWELPVGSRVETVLNLPGLFLDATGAMFPALLIFGLVGLRWLDNRSRWFVISGWLVLWAPLAISRSAGFVRYYYPILPAVVILGGLGLHRLLQRFPQARTRGALVLGALALLGLQLGSVVQTSIHGRLRGDPFIADMRLAADAIDDDRGVIGYRSFFLNLADADIDTYVHDILTEEEYVAFYRWDEEALATLSTERDIGWVLLLRPTDRWEKRYNDAWLGPGFGESARHVSALRDADCLVLEGEEFELYDLDLCLSGSASP